MSREYAQRKSLIPELRPAYWRAKLEAWRLEVNYCEIAALTAIRTQCIDSKLRQWLSDEAEGLDRDVSILCSTLSAAAEEVRAMELARSFEGLSALSQRLADTMAAVRLVREQTLPATRVTAH